MNLETVKELLQMFDESGVTRMRLVCEGLEMELEKGIIMLLGENLRGCRRTAKIVCGHEKLHLLSDSAHYIMPL